MTHTPASDHPHVTEGVCTCPVEYEYEEYVTGGLLFPPGIRRRWLVGRHVDYRADCGLSTHRVKAGRQHR